MLTTEIQALGQWKQEGSQEFKADLSYSVPDQAGLQSKALSQNIGGWGVRIKKRSKGAWQVREERKKREKQVGMVGQTYNPSTWEAKVGGLLSSRSAITT